MVQVDKEVEFIHNKTNHLLFGLVVDESAVLNVGGAAVLECVLPSGKILHSLHHRDFSSSTVAEIKRTVRAWNDDVFSEIYEPIIIIKHCRYAPHSPRTSFAVLLRRF